MNSGVQAVSIQYNFNFFTPAALAQLIDRLRRQRILTTPYNACCQASEFSPAQVKRLSTKPAFVSAIARKTSTRFARWEWKTSSCRSRALSHLASIRRNPPVGNSDPSTHFLISCFGFFLPPKGIDQLIQAFALAKSVQPLLRLKLLNSLYPIAASMEYARQCMGLIDEKGLRGDIQICTGFLDHEETLRELAESDLVVLP